MVEFNEPQDVVDGIPRLDTESQSIRGILCGDIIRAVIAIHAFIQMSVPFRWISFRNDGRDNADVLVKVFDLSIGLRPPGRGGNVFYTVTLISNLAIITAEVWCAVCEKSFTNSVTH